MLFILWLTIEINHIIIFYFYLLISGMNIDNWLGGSKNLHNFIIKSRLEGFKVVLEKYSYNCFRHEI